MKQGNSDIGEQDRVGEKVIELYNGQNTEDEACVCPTCSQGLNYNDERVCCPQCGAAYHKACWQTGIECVVCAYGIKRDAKFDTEKMDLPSEIGRIASVYALVKSSPGIFIVVITVLVVAGAAILFALNSSSVTDNKLLRSLQKGRVMPCVTCVAFSDDGNMAAVGLGNGDAIIWDLRNGAAASKIDVAVTAVEFLTFIRGEPEKLLAVDGDGKVKLYDAETARFTTETEILSDKAGENTVLRCYDGQTLLLGDVSGCVSVYDLKKHQFTAKTKVSGKPVIEIGKNAVRMIVQDADNNLYYVENDRVLPQSVLSAGLEKIVFSRRAEWFACKSGEKIDVYNAANGAKKISVQSGTPIAAFAVDDGGNTALVTTGGELRTCDNSGRETGSLKVAYTKPPDKVFWGGRGDFVYTTGGGAFLRQWDMQRGRCTLALVKQEEWIYPVAFSSNGEYIAIAQKDGVIVKNADDDSAVITLPGNGVLLHKMSFSPNGKMLATAGEEKAVKLWNLDTGRGRDLNGHQGWVNCVAFSPNGEALASAGQDGNLVFWNTESGEKKGVIAGHKGTIRDLQFSKDGKKILSCGDDRQIKEWNADNGDCLNKFNGHERWVDAAKYSADDKEVISFGGDGTERVWDDSTAKQLQLIQNQNDLRNAMIYAADGKVLENDTKCPYCGESLRPGDIIAVCDNCKTPQHVVCWRENGSKCVKCGHNISRPQTIGVDFSQLQAGNNERGVLGKLFSSTVVKSSFPKERLMLASGVVIVLVLLVSLLVFFAIAKSKKRMFAAHSRWIQKLSYSTDGRFLVSAGGDGVIKFWDARNNHFVNSLKIGELPLEDFVITADSKTLITSGWNKEIVFCNVEDAKIVDRVAGHGHTVFSLALSRDGSLLVSGSGDSTVRLWDPVSRELLRSIRAHRGAVHGVAVSSESGKIVSAGSDRTIKIWNFDGKLLLQMQSDDCVTRCLAIHPAGNMLASGDDSGNVTLWNLNNGERMKILKNHSARVRALAFSPDGKKLASASDDTTAVVWRTQTAAQLEVLRGSKEWLCAVTFDMSGRRVAAGGDDKMITVFKIKAG